MAGGHQQPLKRGSVKKNILYLSRVRLITGHFLFIIMIIIIIIIIITIITITITITTIIIIYCCITSSPLSLPTILIMFVIIISISLGTHDPYISSNIKYLPWFHLIASAIEAIQQVAGLKVLPLGWRKWSGGFVVIFSTAKNFSLTFYQLASLFLATKRRPWNFKTRPFKIYYSSL